MDSDQELLIVDGNADRGSDVDLLFLGDASSCCSSKSCKPIRHRKSSCIIAVVSLFIVLVVAIVVVVALRVSRTSSASPSYQAADSMSTVESSHQAEDRMSPTESTHPAADRTSTTTSTHPAADRTSTTTSTHPAADRTSSTPSSSTPPSFTPPSSTPSSSTPPSSTPSSSTPSSRQTTGGRPITTASTSPWRPLSTTTTSASSRPRSTTCSTRSCILAASRLRASMDNTVDPCQDFFEYACGSWNRQNPIPVNQSSFSVLQKLNDELQANLKALLEMPIDRSGPASVTKVKQAYSACINYGTTSMQPFLDILRTLGGWPILESSYANYDRNNFDLETTLADLRYYNSHALFDLIVWPDDENPSVNVIRISQGTLTLTKESYLGPRTGQILTAYEGLIYKVAVALGASSYQALTDASDIVDFEIELAKISLSLEQRLDRNCNKTTVGKLQSVSGRNFDLLKYLRRMFQKAGVTISLNDVIADCTYSYTRNLMYLIRTTSKRTMANYVLWRLVLNMFQFLPPKYAALTEEFDKVVRGVVEGKARWSYCVSYVNGFLGSAVGRIYVDRYFSRESKSNASAMVQMVLETFYELLDEVTWMDDKTRRAAKDKAHAIREKIGYSDSTLNATALDSYYSELAVNSYGHFDNVEAILTFVTQRNLGDLRRPVDRETLWTNIMSPAVVNAMYITASNEIVFPAAILQPPFYEPGYPSYLQLSGIGFITGHEITHGFDDKSYWFDSNNTMKLLWSDEVRTVVDQKAACFVEQYSDYTVAEVDQQLNGKLTKKDNIADNGGLKHALRTYRKLVERRREPEPLLPNLHLTDEQLFFLNFAQTWCGTAKRESYRQTLQTDTHSPGRYRVIGSVSNSPDFAAAYNCPVGSPMNPRHKCTLW